MELNRDGRDQSMPVGDSLELVRHRAAARKQRREVLASIDATRNALREVAPGGTGAASNMKDYSDATVVRQVLLDARVATQNLQGAQQSIARLEKELAEAKNSALLLRIGLIAVAIVVAGFWLARNVR